MSYIPPYKPRQGSNMEAACSAIEEAGQLSCEPLAKILSCAARDVPAYLQIPLKRGYVKRVHVSGVLHFERATEAGEDNVIPPITPAPRPLAASSPFAMGSAISEEIQAEKSQFDAGYAAHEAGEGLPPTRTEPEFARGWFARQKEGRGGIGDIKFINEETCVDQHRNESVFAGPMRAVSKEEMDNDLKTSNIRESERVRLAAPSAFSVGFNTSSEFGMNLGGTQHALTTEQARLLYRVLHSMHLAELL